MLCSRRMFLSRLYRLCLHKEPFRRLSHSKAESPLKKLLDESATYVDKNVSDPELDFATLPYTHIPHEEHTTREKLDPRQTSVILFPGQGSQYVGMGKELLKYPEAKDLYEISSEILGFNLLKLCNEGPVTELNKHCQLAVMVTSLAALEKLKDERPSAIEKCVATAGFSLGEITALVFAGAIPFEQAIKLVQIRATAMEAASQDHPSGMINITYGPDTNVNFAILRAKQYCEEKKIPKVYCQVANYLYPHCKVIAGSEPALQFIEKNYKDLKIRRVQRIKVSGGFHTDIMRSAMEPVKLALNMCDISMPRIKVISNVDGKPYKNERHIRSQLPKQIVRPVRWEQCMHNMFARGTEDYFPQTFTIGPGSSLRTILKQVNAKAWDSTIQIDT